MKDFIRVFFLILGTFIFYGGLFFLRENLPSWLFVLIGVIVTLSFVVYIILLIGIRRPSDADGDKDNI